jgi:hypothetical protein
MSTTTRAKSEMSNIDVGHCKVVKISDIEVSDLNVRDQEVEPPTSEKFQELCDSIKSDGLIEPIVVRPMEGGKYETIAGTRRLRALRHVGAKEVTVVVRRMDDNSVRIASLVENIHRDDLTENEKQKTLEDIYLAGWDEWKPNDWNEIMPREKDRRSGKVTIYDLSTTKGKLILVKQYLNKIKKKSMSKSISNKFSGRQGSRGREEIIFPTQAFEELRERIGYTAGTQANIVAGYGSGRTSLDYIEELPAIARKQFEDDERIKALDEEKKRELAKKQREAIRRAQKQPRVRPSKQKIAKQVADKYLKKVEKLKISHFKPELKQIPESEPKREPAPRLEREAKPIEIKPQFETNPVRAREYIIGECMKLFKILTGQDLSMHTISEGEMQVKSKHANDTMKEIATYYIREGELANLQMAIIPTHQALGRFIDLVYDSLESQHRKDEMMGP